MKNVIDYEKCLRILGYLDTAQTNAYFDGDSYLVNGYEEAAKFLYDLLFDETACARCEETILPHERISEADGELHRECLIRSIVGSVAHQQRKCSCFGGTGHDDKNLSIRENAKRAAQYFTEIGNKIAKAKFN